MRLDPNAPDYWHRRAVRDWCETPRPARGGMVRWLDTLARDMNRRSDRLRLRASASRRADEARALRRAATHLNDRALAVRGFIRAAIALEKAEERRP